jgi:flagellar hook-length control protein FliK
LDEGFATARNDVSAASEPINPPKTHISEDSGDKKSSEKSGIDLSVIKNAGQSFDKNKDSSSNKDQDQSSDKNPPKDTISVSRDALKSSINTAAGSIFNPVLEGSSNPLDSNEPQIGANPAETAQAKAAETVEAVQKSASAFSRADNEAVIRQIMDKMHAAIRNGVHEIRMILRPETLGEVRMSIRVEGDAVYARLQVENSQVKAILESNMQSLKDTLEQHNLSAASLSVDVRADSDKSSEAWHDMVEALRVRKNRAGFAEEVAGSREDNFIEDAVGADTGRRFGSNSFEYFV